MDMDQSRYTSIIGDRVAKLGSAMDDLETQVDGPGGKGDRRAEARSREKVCVYVRPK